MKYSRKKRISKKRISKRKSNIKLDHKQSGGFIGTMFNVAMAPVKMLAKPLYNSIKNKIGAQMNNSPQMNNSQIDQGSLNNIRLNNSHISTLKKLSSYGYNNNTLNSYINQLQHINV